MSDWEQQADAGGSKLNAGAKSFAFNPRARSFVPGGSGGGGAAPEPTEGAWFLPGGLSGSQLGNGCMHPHHA